ncbi:phosphoenolpyruvate carboxykinase [Sulfurimonas hongkongensis]|uniref:Phosphoenolpyruvate carboxykinase (ATP) n=1 Tax=Sulfurimonas hongkongensis TaxID=1172190 RepID=T0JFZ3_9BACT|nr:phosphoenolpyruvate carboxykinase (ATP) [Sulfurimonas hongkongensis]EQB40020.1 phosphoenolpyruvate carboxykinase [Sulfurimonas hongkongensis]
MHLRELEELGLQNIGKIHHNLSYDELIQHELDNGECAQTKTGATAVDTGIFTGRSPQDKYFVDRDPSNKYIAWGDVNKKVSAEIFQELLEVAKKQLSGKDIYVTDAFCGASAASKRSVRFVSEIAWQSHFVKNMFIRPTSSELEVFNAEFTVLNACKAVNEKWEEHGLNSEVFVLFDVENNIAIIGGTWYGGEMKKGIFSMMNYWLPLEGKLAMHCSANVGEDGDTALFFGLSGTGKTTLSTDPKRALIGDDEHGWDNHGVFNFEGGCYAKVINLDAKSEPEIYNAIRTNALLENVVMYGEGEVDYEDSSKTENTRVSYPIEHIENHKEDLMAGHPQNIIFLTADAFGILPPVSKLTKEQAMYYFLSGYTAKVAGTERGVTEPVATFSACFGEAFLPLHPTVYANLLGEKIDKHNVHVYLVNTGWTGGGYGVGKRMSIKNTRSCINAILDGTIKDSEFDTIEVFGLQVPKTLGDINPNILNPRNAWSDKKLFDTTRDRLAKMFIENYTKYQTEEHTDFAPYGPKL